MEYIAIFKPASGPNLGNVAAGKRYDHVSADIEYPRVANRRWIGTRKASQGGLA